MREDVSSVYFNTNQETGEVVLTFKDENGLWNQNGQRITYTDCSKRKKEVWCEAEEVLYEPGFYIGVHNCVEDYAKKVSVNTIQSGEALAMIAVANKMTQGDKRRGIEIRTDCAEAKPLFDAHRAKHKKWSKVEVTHSIVFSFSTL